MIDNKEILEKIRDAQNDTRYILDDSTPKKGLIKTLTIWFSSYLVFSIILYFISNYAMTSLNENLFSLVRVMTVILFLLTIVIYVISVYKIKMTFKEKDFLTFFTCFIAIMAFIRMIFPISYWLKADFLLSIFDSFPIESLVVILALFVLFNYFRTKTILLIILLNIVGEIAVVYFISSFLNSNMPTEMMIKLYDMSMILKNNGGFVMISFAFLLILLNLKKV